MGDVTVCACPPSCHAREVKGRDSGEVMSKASTYLIDIKVNVLTHEVTVGGVKRTLLFVTFYRTKTGQASRLPREIQGKRHPANAVCG